MWPKAGWIQRSPRGRQIWDDHCWSNLLDCINTDPWTPLDLVAPSSNLAVLVLVFIMPAILAATLSVPFPQDALVAIPTEVDKLPLVGRSVPEPPRFFFAVIP